MVSGPQSGHPARRIVVAASPRYEATFISTIALKASGSRASVLRGVPFRLASPDSVLRVGLGSVLRAKHQFEMRSAQRAISGPSRQRPA